MIDINRVYYVFKDVYQRKLKDNYKSVTDKINYYDILESNILYKNFIKRLNYLMTTLKSFSINEYTEINRLLNSDDIMDRLTGLKKCRLYIKTKI